MPATSSFYDKIERQLADGDVRPRHYLTAIVMVLLAGPATLGLQAAIGPGHTFILFYPSVMIAAWFGGLKPGLLATVLSGTFCVLFLPGYLSNLVSPGSASPFLLAIFVGLGILMSFLMDVLHYMVKRLRKAHRELHQQHEWFRTTLTSIGDAVIVTDHSGTVSFLNGEAERLTGWLSTEAKNKPLLEVFRIVNEQTRNSVENPVEKVFREKRVVGLANHTILIAKNGVEWPIEDSASPIYDEPGKILGVVLVFHDATELRRNQRSLQMHADELEHKVLERTLSLQRTVSDLEAFSYSVSHDLRSPLRAMLGYSQALLEDFPELPKQAADYAQRIARSAERLDHLIQDLLNFSRISRDDDPISPVDLDRLVRDIVQQYPDFQGTADIIIEGKLPAVLGYETALTQVVSNLLGNAIKFVPPDRRPQVIVRAEIRDPIVRLTFTDNGIGISTENQGRIFRMFEQVNPPGNYPGTGIGLAVVKKAVEKMQGSLGVESTVGKGSQFWIELLKANAG